MARVGGASFQVLHLLWPRHRQRAGRSVGTVVQLNGDGLDPAHGLVALDAARVVSRSRLVVIEKSRLAAAGCAAHAGKAPMHRRST